MDYLNIASKCRVVDGDMLQEALRRDEQHNGRLSYLQALQITTQAELVQQAAIITHHMYRQDLDGLI
jgi:hypothetical protein